jgi:hypothetical protein
MNKYSKIICVRLDEDLIASIKKQSVIPSKFIRRACINAIRFEKLIKQAEKMRSIYRINALEVKAKQAR